MNAPRIRNVLVPFVLLMLPIAGAPQRTAQPGSDRLPRAHWIENGMIDAGGSHEPYLFVLRRGGMSLDARRQYEEAQSEDVIRRLKEQGAEVFHTHLYKGFGMVAERPEMDDAKRVAAIVHRYGMKLDSYIQWNTMMYETFFAEEPRAQEWIQRDALGKPIMLVYGYQQSYRYRPCFANQEYLDYLKRIVRYAVEEVKTDFIHFDNFDLNPEPDSCHCPVCVRKFREFLRAKYPPNVRKERFGFENVDYVNPPQWNAQNPPDRMEIIFDPAIQEWVDFRCQVMADALRQMAQYAKSLNPEVAIEVNPHGITGENRAWGAGLDHARFLKSTEAFWTEEENDPGYLPDGRLITKIRSYKLARAFDNILLTYTEQGAVAMAECLAFDQTIGFAGQDPLSPAMLKYISFYRRNRDLFAGAKDVVPVAILRSYPSITYHNARAQLSAILTEQALIQNRVPFGLIFDEQLADLSKYRVVILPDSECLSNAQLESIRKFVNDGGGLVAVGQSGLYDEWRRLRVRPGLDGLVDGQKRAEAYQERVIDDRSPESRPARKEFGKGRAAYIPEVQFDGPLPQAEPNYAIGNRFWKNPRNAGDLVNEIRWTAGGALPMEISGPPYLVSNLVSQVDRRRVMIHLVNYNAAKAPQLDSIRITFHLPDGASLKDARVFSPDEDAPGSLEASSSGSAVYLTVPRIKTYAIVVLSW